MKGVIVQVGHPKSIVLFNNGRIRAIPTPANCQVGMVVTMKYNNLLKIMIIGFVAVLLIALGVFIGARFFGGTSSPGPAEPWPGGPGRGRMMEYNESWPGGHGHRRMMERWQQSPPRE
ncbi:MAG: hypothetical protein FWH19_01700 [Treponema sp.]|nr:hypothetical protein [Treponema sp.]